MSNKTFSDLVEGLILARLLVTTEKKTERSRVKTGVGQIAGQRMSTAEWTQLFDECFQRLVESAAITARPLQLTEAGRQRALRFLGIQHSPANLSWTAVKRRYLTARALGIDRPDHDSRQGLEKADNLRGAILRREHNLKLGDCPTLNRAAEALAWKQLGVQTDRPFNKKEVVAYLVRRALGQESPPVGNDGKDPDRVAASQAVLKAIGAKTAGGSQLHDAALRHWVDQVARTEEPGDRKSTPSPSEAAAVAGLSAFAGTIKEAAKSCPEGRFGDNKVFISHVWRRVQADATLGISDFPEFQRMLVEGHRQGLLHLSQADLVEAMDPRDVAESATPYVNMTFHFIRV